MFFQEAASDGVGSVVNHANLVKKIYFPREIFPLASVLTVSVQLGIGLVILALMMLWYQWAPTWHALWLLPLLLYTMLTALALSLAGAASDVYVRDLGQGIPLLLSMAMYLTPVIYPLDLVRRALLENQAAGSWSDALFTLYTLNPMTGAIHGFQRALLKGTPPDWAAMAPRRGAGVHPAAHQLRLLQARRGVLRRRHLIRTRPPAHRTPCTPSK